MKIKDYRFAFKKRSFFCFWNSFLFPFSKNCFFHLRKCFLFIFRKVSHFLFQEIPSQFFSEFPEFLFPSFLFSFTGIFSFRFLEVSVCLLLFFLLFFTLRILPVHFQFFIFLKEKGKTLQCHRRSVNQLNCVELKF